MTAQPSGFGPAIDPSTLSEAPSFGPAIDPATLQDAPPAQPKATSQPSGFGPAIDPQTLSEPIQTQPPVQSEDFGPPIDPQTLGNGADSSWQAPQPQGSWQQSPPGFLRSAAGDLVTDATFGLVNARTPESQAAHDSAMQSLSNLVHGKGSVSQNLGGVIKDSAFSDIQILNNEIKQATTGLHVGPDREGVGYGLNRYVDKNGNPIPTEDVESGNVKDYEVEPPLDYFFGGLKGKPAPYFISHGVNSTVAQAFSSGNPTLLETLHSEWLGTKEVVKDPHITGIWKGLSLLSEPGQAVARMAVYGLSKIGAIPPSDAKQMLSQEQLFNHDIVDYFGLDHAQGATERVGLAGSGFLTDFIDPLMMTGTAQPVSRLGEDALQVGDRTITDLGQISRLEKFRVNVANDVKRVIMDDGSVINPQAEGVLQNPDWQDQLLAKQNQNLSVLNRFKNTPDGMPPMNFNDLSDQLDLSDDGKAALKQIYRERMSPSIWRELANGERQLVAKIPFSDTAIHIPFVSEMPKWMDSVPNAQGLPSIGQKFAQTLLDLKTGTGSALESLDRWVAQSHAIGQMASTAVHYPLNKISDAADFVTRGLRMFATDTARPIFNWSARTFYNDKGMADFQASQFKDTWYRAFMDDTGKVDTDKLKQVMDLLDTEPQRSDEFYLNQLKTEAQPEAYARLSEIRAKAAQMRSTMDANQLRLADTIQQQNVAAADAMKARGIPFYELNPLREGQTATGYVKHILLRNFASQYESMDEAREALNNFAEGVNKAASGSLMERQGVATAREINSAYAKANEGAKIIVEDPIEAHLTRMREMQNMIRNHDLMYTLDDLAVYRGAKEPLHQPGYIEINPEDWGQGKFKRETASGEKLTWSDQFLPEKMKTWMGQGGHIYLPEDVNTRLTYMLNPLADAPKTGPLAATARGMNYLFRNTALFGPGYLGTRMFAHLNTAIYSGTDLTRIADALKILTPMADDPDSLIQFKDGSSMTREQAFNLALSHGMIRTGFMSEDGWDNALENIATTREQRANLGKKALSVFDHANFFSFNRAISNGIDDTGKVAHFLSKLDEGYTPAAAAESSEFWFYNYQMRPHNAAYDTAKAIIPFSTTGIKTMEQSLQALKEMNIAHLTLPAKVNAVLSGVYVPDWNTRQFIADVVPNWMKNNIYGPMLPGARELMIEYPWVFHTMNALWSPFSNQSNDVAMMPVNPLIKLPIMGFAAMKDWDNSDFSSAVQTEGQEWLNEMAISYLPPLFKQGLIDYQLNHPDQNWPVDFKLWYTPKSAFAPTARSTSAANQKFANAIEFGDWVNKNYGDNWALNLYLYGTPESPKGPINSATDKVYQEYYSDAEAMRENAITAGVGNLVASRMRDLSMGLTGETKLDVDFFSRDSALRHQAKQIMEQMRQHATQRDMSLVAPGALMNKNVQEAILKDGDPEQRQLMAEHMALTNKIAALHEFYGYVLKDDKEGTGIFRQIFGIEPNKVQMYENLKAGALDQQMNYRKYDSQLKAGDGQ